MRVAWLSLLGLAAVVLPVIAQAPILEFRIAKLVETVPQGGHVTLALRAENVSVYEADDLEVLLLEGTLALAPVDPVSVIAPFEVATLPLELDVAEDEALGPAVLRFEVAYTYCIGELCYQVVETLDSTITIGEAASSGPDSSAVQTAPAVNADVPVASFREGASVWQILAPYFIVAAILGAFALGRLRKGSWGPTALLGLALIVSFILGFQLRQDQQAQSIGAVLCTSCVGIEEAPHAEPTLSVASRVVIEAIDQPIELEFFTAAWCHACPFAKAMVQQVLELNAFISYREIDVEVDRALAEEAGVIRSGRTVVPAVVRVDTGEIIFGIEDLEARLLRLLEAEE